ncbi:MAG: biotin--[acetyl-CoA-carboxylase] ligase [Pseudomonadales bacterium]|jgi:BirA family biotin operon repressor/biotin-[acetyl-CoA-carboxylase] ligase|nr:biotin--[acetyl-CoA-carboxylase] ligase [Pseudomonadales bacterium]
MIKSTHPEFEKLIAGNPVYSTLELLDFLDGIGVSYTRQGSVLTLNPGMELLDEAAIRTELQHLVSELQMSTLDLEIHRVTQSTNDVVMQRLVESQSTAILCAAEMQTAGKGRRGRRWISPFGRNVYLTYGRFIGRQLSELGGLSLVVGMVVVDVLRAMGLERVGLKWPNDILLGGGKLGGILLELRASDTGGIGLVAGVGLNLALNVKESLNIDQPWSAISSQLEMPRNILLGTLGGRIVNAIQTFEDVGFDSFAEKWSEYNLYTGQQVNVIRGSETISGIDSGVDQQGNLLLRTGAGLEVHNSGEVSVRPVART